MCRKEDISYLPPMTPFSSAANMRSFHTEASTHLQSLLWASAPCVALRHYRRFALALLRRKTHASTFLSSLPSERLYFPPLSRLSPQRYYGDSDSCAAHLRRRSPRLLRHTFLPFRLQPRGLPGHRFSHHASVTSDFRASLMESQAHRSFPPNRVRYPTDQQFASGCSPPCLGATQLPSATELWHTPTRTFTVLMWRPHGRTHSRENGNPAFSHTWALAFAGATNFFRLNARSAIL